MIRKIVFVISLIPPFIGIMIVAISNRLTYGMEYDEIYKAKELIFSKETFGNVGQYIGLDTGITLFLYMIKQYGYWIVSASLIWIVIVIYIFFSTRNLKKWSNRRKKNEKRK